MQEDEELRRKLNEVEKWACCGEPESRVRAEHRIKMLEKLLSAVTIGTSEFEGIQHNDVDGKNWFDLRDEIMCKK